MVFYGRHGFSKPRALNFFYGNMILQGEEIFEKYLKIVFSNININHFKGYKCLFSKGDMIPYLKAHNKKSKIKWKI